MGERKIFVSYRREDSAGHAGRIYDRLVDHFGADKVFRDIDAISAGEDFVEAIRRALRSCDIVIIGRWWSSITDSKGRRRLDDPEDLLRMEVAEALARDIRVIPILVEGAAMPSPEELPPELVKLARRNALEFSDSRFQYDMDRLIAATAGVRQERRAEEKPLPGKPFFITKHA